MSKQKLIAAPVGYYMLSVKSIHVSDIDNLRFEWRRLPVVAFDVGGDVTKYKVIGLPEFICGPLLCPDGGIVITKYEDQCDTEDFLEGFTELDKYATDVLKYWCTQWVKYECGEKSNTNEFGLFFGIGQVDYDATDMLGVDAWEGFSEFYHLVKDNYEANK